jgi:glycosyltransferase involved in cell wall biosynthesis
MRTLVLITSNFPFGTGEPFLEAEFPIIYREFARIIIFSQNVEALDKRDIPENVIVFRYNTATTLRGFLNLPALLYNDLCLISELYRNEKQFRKQSHFHLSLRQKLFLLKKIIKAVQLRDFIKSRLKNLQVESDIVFYSYWLTSGAHASAMLKYNNSIRISRAHRYDLYEESNRLSYLPLLKFLAVNLDSVFFISEHGRKYFTEKTNSVNQHLTVSYLGVRTPESIRIYMSDNEPFTIVSCSSLSFHKRVDMIIESLSAIRSGRKIRWIHFGDGPLRNNLENLAKIRLGSKENIIYEFRGQVPNNEIQKFYNNNKVDLFLNTSSGEGIPVSIMEAQSYGTPVIAADTGGVSELVIPGTGFLLPVDFKSRDLAEKIGFFLDLNREELEQIRGNAYLNGKNNFDAEKNYRDFIKKVNSIFESALIRPAER